MWWLVYVMGEGGWEEKACRLEVKWPNEERRPANLKIDKARTTQGDTDEQERKAVRAQGEGERGAAFAHSALLMK